MCCAGSLGTAACYKYIRTPILWESVLVGRVDCVTIIKLLQNACDDVQRQNKKIMNLVNVILKHPVANGIRVFLPEHTKPRNIIRKPQKSKWVSVVGSSNVCPVNILITFKIVETLLLWYWLNEQWFLSRICFKNCVQSSGVLISRLIKVLILCHSGCHY